MTNLKNDLQADAVGNLYRAAFYLAKSEQILALNFLKKATQKIPKENLKSLKPLLDNPKFNLSSKIKEKYWAEKILDEYKILLNQINYC